MAASAEEIATLLRQEHHPHPTEWAELIVELLHQPQLVADAVTTRARDASDAGVGQPTRAIGCAHRPLRQGECAPFFES